MEMPSVSNLLTDTAKNIRYDVVAYRTLSRQELIQAVQIYLVNTKKKPKRNSSVKIVSIIGLRD